ERSIPRQQARGLCLLRGTAWPAATVWRDPAGAVGERAPHFAGALVTVARIERQRDRHRVGELRTHGCDERVEHRRRLLLLLERQLGERGGLVWQPPGDELVGDDAQRVQVGGGPGFLAAHL